MQMLLADRMEDAVDAALQDGERRFCGIDVSAVESDVFAAAVMHSEVTAFKPRMTTKVCGVLIRQ